MITFPCQLPRVFVLLLLFVTYNRQNNSTILEDMDSFASFILQYPWSDGSMLGTVWSFNKSIFFIVGLTLVSILSR